MRRLVTIRTAAIIILWLFVTLLAGKVPVADGQQQQQQQQQEECSVPKASVGSTPRQYVVGANSWHIPVLDYLTEFIGPEFDPPISFFRITANQYLDNEIEDSLKMGYDFMVANPYQTACFESETNAVPLATQVSLDQDAATGESFNLTQYGATLYVLSNRTDIQTLKDVKGKKIGTNKFKNLATHLCYDLLLQSGIHHLQDPEQTIFFDHSNDALEALLAGKVDVGCAASSILEQYIDPNTDERLDLSQIRILSPQNHTSDGIPFPFRISSDLVPGYLFIALPHVETSVRTRVQRELIAMVDHADVAPSLLGCLDGRGCSVNNTQCLEDCFQALPVETVRNCDTTAERALKAYDALAASEIVKFTDPLSNLRMRDIEESAGFLIKEPSPRCVRLNNIVDATTCPPGHFARSSKAIVEQCETMGLECYEVDCICSPCVKAFEVDFFAVAQQLELNRSFVGSGCSKFDLCGSVEQEHTLVFHAIDNMDRFNGTLTGSILMEDESEDIFTFQKTVNGTFHFHFHASNMTTGQKIVKVRMNGEEIPESPFRIVVEERDCPADTGDELQMANALGECVCSSGTVAILDKCVPLAILVPSILVPIFFLFLVAVHVYVKHKRDQSDNLWKIEPTELHFEEPPRVLGRGTFGLVLMAEYRGTSVAVKRILPPDEKSTPLGRLPPSLIEFPESPVNATLPPILEEQMECGSCKENDTMNKATHHRGAMSRSSTISSRYPCSNQVLSSRAKGGIIRTISLLPRTIFQKRQTLRRQKDFIEEIRLLSRLRHPCITTVMGAVVSSKQPEPMLVMEYMHFGSLYDLLHNESMALESTQLISILQDVASGLRFLHSSDPTILHGDLKSQNILVDNKFRAKVADFGCGHHGPLHKKGSTVSRQGSHLRSKIRGTPFWMAPELLRAESENTTASDIYAFGVLMYEVFAREEPYVGEPYDEVIRLLCDEAANKRPPVPKDCPAEAAKVLNACLQWNPANRPNATGLDICLGWMGGSNIETSSTSFQQKNSDSSRSKNCLEKRFPPHIAKALRESRTVEPETHEEVTIVFLEIVGYSEIASAMSATKVSELLERLYTPFDELCERLKVFKVETIGDAYMAVANLVEPQFDHASLAARFAIEAMHIALSVPIDAEDPSAGNVEIRIGFHTGPVMTHVIGTMIPRFTLIGDTVNTAARMGRTSEPGKVLCSEESYKLLSSNKEIEVVERGIEYVKGKGFMQTYWISESLERPGSQ